MDYVLIKDIPGLKSGSLFKKEGEVWRCGKFLLNQDEVTDPEFFIKNTGVTTSDVAKAFHKGFAYGVSINESKWRSDQYELEKLLREINEEDKA